MQYCRDIWELRTLKKQSHFLAHPVQCITVMPSYLSQWGQLVALFEGNYCDLVISHNLVDNCEAKLAAWNVVPNLGVIVH